MQYAPEISAVPSQPVLRSEWKWFRLVVDQVVVQIHSPLEGRDSFIQISIRPKEFAFKDSTQRPDQILRRMSAKFRI